MKKYLMFLREEGKLIIPEIWRYLLFLSLMVGGAIWYLSASILLGLAIGLGTALFLPVFGMTLDYVISGKYKELPSTENKHHGVS